MKTYRPINPSDPIEANIFRAANRSDPYAQYEVLHDEPRKVLPGMFVFADGTDWNPGSGAGFYRRNEANSAWVAMDSALRTDLAASGGSALISVLSDVASAVSRSLQTVFRQDIPLTPQACGPCDSAANTLLAFQRFAAASARRKRIPAGTYDLSQLTDPLSFQPGDWIEGDGDATVLDASGAGLAAGEAVIKIAGTLTSLGALMSAGATEGDVSIAFSSVAGISVGDVLCIYNSTNSSWSAHRTYYRSGEFIRVGRIVGTTVYPTGPLYGTYPNTVTVYKLGGTSARLSNFKVKTQAAQVLGWQIDASVDVSVEHVHTIGSTYTGGEFMRCAGIHYAGAAFQSTVEVDDEYGVAVSNCQWGNFYLTGIGGRHPVSLGGGDYACSVPTRAISLYGSQAGNLGAIGAGDLHGNTEDCKFFGLTFANGATLGGANHKFTGCWFRGQTNSGMALYAGEPVKGTFELNGCTLDTSVNPNASSYGLATLGNLTNAAAALRFVFNDCIYKAPNTTQYAVRVDITAGSYAPDIVINGGVNLCTGLTQLVRLARSGGAATIDLVKIADVAGLPSGAYYAYNAGAGLTVTRYELPEQAGTVNVAVTNAASFATQAVTFRHPYPSAPIVTGTLAAHTYGSKRAIGYCDTPSATGFNAGAATADGANFGGSENAVLRWTARMAD